MDKKTKPLTLWMSHELLAKLEVIAARATAAAVEATGGSRVRAITPRAVALGIIEKALADTGSKGTSSAA